MGNSTSSDQVPVTITDDVIDIYDDDLTGKNNAVNLT